MVFFCFFFEGNIVVWDMNEKKIFSQIKGAHSNEVSYLEF
jgi:hypothetical protein